MAWINFALVVYHRRWLVLVLGIIGISGAMYWSIATRRDYESTVTLQLNPASTNALLPYAADANGAATITSLAATYSELLRSQSFAHVVVDQLNLSLPPGAIAASISARLTPNTDILRITVTWGNPLDAKTLAQAVAQIFIAENLRRQSEAGGTQSRLTQMESTAAGYLSSLNSLRPQRDRLDQAVTRGDLSQLTELNALDTRL